jgi:hypothetical protein
MQDTNSVKINRILNKSDLRHNEKSEIEIAEIHKTIPEATFLAH